MAIMNLEELANLINGCSDYPTIVVNEVIEKNDWIDLQHKDFDICSDGIGKLTFTESGKTVVVPLND